MTHHDGTHTEHDIEEKDVAYSPASETETEVKQEEGTEASETAQDSEVDSEAVQVLPGTGGPDDVGEVQIDPDDLDLNGREFPGHPSN